MNELLIKQTLQDYLAANTSYKWDTTDESFVNIYEGELFTNDRILSNQIKQKLMIEFSISLYSIRSLELLDDDLLTAKKILELALLRVKNTTLAVPLRGLTFESWKKDIETSASSDQQVQYKGKLSLYYSLIILGFNQVT